jgi:hypothetical protein
LIKVAPGNNPFWGTANAPRCDDKEPTPVDQYAYRDSVNDNDKVTNVVADLPEYLADTTNRCKEVLFYKTINSTVKHSSPTPEETQSMNITTPDRPIDVERYTSFQGYGNTIVRLDYPNLYDVPVYKKSGNLWILKTPIEIQQAITETLQSTITKYNAALTDQNARIQSVLSANKKAWKKLAAKNPLASPD